MPAFTHRNTYTYSHTDIHNVGFLGFWEGSLPTAHPGHSQTPLLLLSNANYFISSNYMVTVTCWLFFTVLS